MFKPHTIEHYKVFQFLKEQFELESCVVSPLSRCALMLEDHTGERIAFAWKNHQVMEIPIPEPASPEEIQTFMEWFRGQEPKPQLRTLEDVYQWWLEHPNPLTLQQALGLSDTFYRHYLTHPLLDDESAWALTENGLVTEEDYRSLQLWYRRQRKSPCCWLGPVGVDGIGNSYCLIRHYRQPEEVRRTFYLLDDYYREMNHIL